MSDDERVQDEMFSWVTLEQRVPLDHHLREIRKLVDAVLVSLNGEFAALYLVSGRPSNRALVWASGVFVAGLLLDPFGASTG